MMWLPWGLKPDLLVLKTWKKKKKKKENKSLSEIAATNLKESLNVY